MLALETPRRWVGALPLLARVGLVWLIAALAADATIHAGVDLGLLGSSAHAIEYLAHVAVLAGMVLIYLGVVIGGVRKPRRSKTARPKKGVN